MSEYLIRLLCGVVYCVAWLSHRAKNALLIVLGCLVMAAEAAYFAAQDWNDERAIRSIERDVITTARRMNKVASR